MPPEVAPVVGEKSRAVQAGLGMLLVLGLIFACAWLARRFGLQRFGGGGQVVKVVSTASIGQRERVVVVEVADTWLVLGVTSNQINTLHSLPAQSVPGARVAAPATTAARQPGRPVRSEAARIADRQGAPRIMMSKAIRQGLRAGLLLLAATPADGRLEPGPVPA